MTQAFAARLGGPLATFRPDCLQVNLGKLCNQACRHCHVDAGPKRTEIMERQTIDQVLRAIELLRVPTVDLTGGAPELNPDFRYLVTRSRALGVKRVIDRCNLTILFEKGQEDLAEFLAANEVEVTASLPFYVEENVDRQRGSGVFHKSIEGLRLLNRHGYGRTIPLNLVYNPQGAYLPPDQGELTELYRRTLGAEFGIVFNDLYTITNMPISRFADYLKRSGNYESYMAKLVSRYNPATLGALMCRSLISVGWDGQLYDCDFNQMLDLPLMGSTRHIAQIEELVLEGRAIAVANHCYGCTAGSGSSCGGALENSADKKAVPV